MVLNWTSDLIERNPHVGGGDIARDKRKMAFQTGENDSTLSVYYIPSFPTSWKDGEPNAGSDPHLCYRYSDAPGGAFGVPTFSPDGGAAGLARRRRHPRRGRPVLRRRLHARRRDPGAAAGDPRRPRARLGPGRRPAARARPGRRQHRRRHRRPSRQRAEALSVKVLSATRRNGVKVNVKVAGKGKLTATAKVGKKVVGKASKTVKKAGTASLKLKVSRKGKATLKVTFKPDLRPVPDHHDRPLTSTKIRLKRGLAPLR